MTPHTRCQIIPPFLLEAVARGGGRSGESARRTLVADERIRGARERGERRSTALTAVGGPAWSVHDAEGGTDLPGRRVRRPGEAPTGDVAVDEAAEGVTASLALFDEVYGRSSFDGQGAEVIATVHFDQLYNNAFWNGEQLVFGDGDGEIFGRFTASVDVLGHELAHAVTERTAGLVYRNQPGALNEHLSDVFGTCVDQRLKGQTPDQADWLIGSELLLPGVDGVALRSMKAPGTAYDDPRLGKDPQPAHMRDFVKTDSDNGGVHINSGIPNKAFQLAATAIGGTSWDGAGRIWYAALTGGEVRRREHFRGFAAATVAAAGEHADAVAGAWDAVGVDATMPADG